MQVIKINGHNATGRLQLNYEPIKNLKDAGNIKSTKFTFASYYDAEYTIVGACSVFGGTPNKVYNPLEFKVIVAGSPSGALPENQYK